MQRLVVVDDLHAPAAQHVGRPHQHRIADLGGDLAGLLEGGRHAELRGRQPGADQQVAERAAVLGQVDGLGRSADNRHPRVGEPLRQPQRRLAAELHDHARRTPGPPAPDCDSAWNTSRTSSNVSGSKYSRSAVS